MQLRNVLAERHECQEGHFEVLDSERDAYDGDAEDYAKGDMSQCYFNSSEYDPDYIHQDAQTSGVSWSWSHIMAERPKCQPRYLK